MKSSVWMLGFALIASVALFDGVAIARDLADDPDRASYSLGHQIGTDLKKLNLDVNDSDVEQGIEDALKGAEPRIPASEMRRILLEVKNGIRQMQQAEQARLRKNEMDERERNMKAAKAYLEANAKKPEVIARSSGLQYRVLASGSGNSPGPTDIVKVHYRGTLIDGSEFDSSYRRNEPSSFPVNGVIAGWTEALQLMKEGDKWEIVIPPQLAYGDRGPLAGRILVFEIELLSVGEGEKKP